MEQVRQNTKTRRSRMPRVNSHYAKFLFFALLLVARTYVAFDAFSQIFKANVKQTSIACLRELGSRFCATVPVSNYLTSEKPRTRVEVQYLIFTFSLDVLLSHTDNFSALSSGAPPCLFHRLNYIKRSQCAVYPLVPLETQ